MVIDEWQGCNADECPYDKEYGDCENCSYLIRKQNFVPMSVLQNIKADIDKLDFDFGDFYDHTTSIHEMIDEVWNKYIESEDKE